jgi:exodeoxyribonuclease VII large subunit
MLITDRLGTQHIQFERTKAALEKDGLFDSAKKRPLPAHPVRIAVVTSPDGAALQDIITVSYRRWPSLELWVVGAKVQGVEAERELVRAFAIVNRLPGMDLCLVARGGGSREDLAAFNSEAVCRALARVAVPTISAVGHETDISLTDLVADARAATPSAAVELAVPDRGEWIDRLNGLARRLAGSLDQGARLTVERLERTGDRLQAAMTRAVDRRRQEVDQLGVQLDALSPLRVLERGFALPRDRDGHILRGVEEFPSGLAFRLRVVNGEIAARVEEKS